MAPIRQLLKRSVFMMGRVGAVDFAARTLAIDALAGAQSLAYEHVVFAFGQRARLDLLRIEGTVVHDADKQTT